MIKYSTSRKCGWMAACLMLLCGQTNRLSAQPLDTAIRYQGLLSQGGQPASGSYDLRFALWDAAEGGQSVAGPLTNSSVQVQSGLFAVALDFGLEAFDGSRRWLEIGCRQAQSGEDFVLLQPRQPVYATPYALRAGSAPAPTNLPIGALQDVALGPLSSGQFLTYDPAQHAWTNAYALDGRPASASYVDAMDNGGAAAANGQRFNINPQALGLWWDKLYTNSGPITLLCLGDSMATGLWSQVAGCLTPLLGINGRYLAHCPVTGYGSFGQLWWDSRWPLPYRVLDTNGYGIIEWGPMGYVPANELQLFYLLETNGATLNVFVQTNGTTNWVCQASLSTAGVEQAGAWTNFSLATASYRFMLTCSNGSAFFLHAGYGLTNSGGLRLADFSYGGLAILQYTLTPTNHLKPALDNLNPDLVFLEFKDEQDFPGRGEVATNLVPLLYYVTNLWPQSTWIVIGSSPMYGYDQDYQRIQNQMLQDWCRTNGLFYFDAYTIFGDTNQMIRNGFLRDRVHRTTAGDAFAASYLIQDLRITSSPIWTQNLVRNNTDQTFNGTLRFNPSATGAPTNPATPVTWIPININGTNLFVPAFW